MTDSTKMPKGADILLGRSVWAWDKDREQDQEYYGKLRAALHAEYIYVGGDRDRFMSVRTGRMVEQKVMNARYASIVPRDEKENPISASTILLTSHALRRAADVAFRPGREIFFEENGEWFANLWLGFGADPKAGDCSIWVDHWTWICNGNPVEYNRVFDFFAHMVQKPDEKIRRMILVIGRPGIGKDLGLEPIKAIIGRRNVRTPRKDTLMSRFNGWAASAHLAICSEFKLNSQDEFERIKELCTNDDIDVESKGRDQKQALNYSNLFAFSNHDAACMLPEDDRRVDVIKSPVDSMEKKSADPAYYRRLRDFCRSSDGVAAVMAWLKARDLSNFDAGDHAPMSEAKREMGKLAIEPHDAWLDLQLSEMRAPFLNDVVSINDILADMKSQKEPSNLKKVGIWMKARGHLSLGQHSVNGGRPVLWAVRNHDLFKTAENWQIKNAYMGQPVDQKLGVVVDNTVKKLSEPEIIQKMMISAREGNPKSMEYWAEQLARAKMARIKMEDTAEVRTQGEQDADVADCRKYAVP